MIKEHIEKAFELLGSISVRGADVDVLAAARQELRLAYAETQKEEQKDG